jgi:glycosyltransferase involved in cell wall biosynthesis
MRSLLAPFTDRDRLRQQALGARLAAVLTAATGAPADSAQVDALAAQVARLLRSDRPDILWLLLATVLGSLPTSDDVRAAARSCDFDGAEATLAAIIRRARPDGSRLTGEWVTVEVAVGSVLVDLHHTSRTALATGIQRVARQSARRWHDNHPITLVGWSRDFSHLRRLTSAQAEVALYGAETAAQAITPSGSDSVIVPWHGTYVLPELMTERDRALRLQALVMYSHCRSAAIGFDCVPLTSAETIGEGMGAGFSINLTAVARMDRVATISEAAAVEYRGWRSMLVGAGLRGPEIEPIGLAVEAATASTDAIEQARRELAVGAMPLVLVVGSHEPRKNHLAILHAAEKLWREGLRFSLTFVGGNAWNSNRFTNRLAQLQGIGRPVHSVSALSEDMLWAAYEVASFTVFPSMNEGFGLPVAESLATGTPVVTAGYGSMLEIAGGGGALLIDPRSDDELTDAMRTLLTDPAVHAELSAQARLVTGKSWDKYASEVWHHLVESEDSPAARPAALENGI